MPPINQVARDRQFYGGVGDIFDVRLIMLEVAATTSTKLSRAMGIWAKTIDKKASKARNNDLRAVHKKTADAARSAVLEAYLSSGIGSEFPSYRYNDTGKLRRYSNGAMERAIQHKDFVVGDERGIRFIDQDMMDRTAKQWYRLNFGAKPGTSKDPAVGSMRFFGRASSQRAELNGFGPSESFSIPAGGKSGGFFATDFKAQSRGKFNPTAPGQRGAFYIRSRGIKFAGKVPPKFMRGVPTKKGITGKRFLDAGARAINREYPRLLTEMIRKWENDALRAAKRSR